MNLEEALAGKEIPDKIKKSITLVSVPYFSFGREVCEGQLEVHTEVAEEVRGIFTKLLEMRFPIAQIVPVAAFGWDDDASMAANNSSAFNYRVIFGTNRLSNHSFGRAIDINPVQNPYVQRGGAVVPPGAHYDPKKLGTVTPEVAALFKSYGWEWGGNWVERKDWQHFEKPATS
ncbi:MAG: M15 family metallopeptidase [Patescibacteria group bacterium]|nr:M15 family metallopeptidase [Patescibacteria group bacterium]